MQGWLNRIIGVFILLILIILGLKLLYYNDPVPAGKHPEKADILAHKMLEAINYEAYKNTQYLSWSYRRGRHQYRWDKAMGKVSVEWGENIVLVNLNDPDKSIIKAPDKSITESERQELIKQAVSYFNNDSFWLVAPFKVFDKGTKRSLVPQEDGSSRLLVTYTTGGDTPGDSYLWELNETGLPVSFRMWVQIVPLNGFEASWEGWHTTESGALLPQSHKVGPFTLDLGTVRAW